MRPVTGLAAVDAHARIGTDEDAEQQPSRTILARPTYRDMFRAVAQAVPMSEPMSGDAALDAKLILDALRSGRTYSVVRALADPGQITFEAASSDQRAVMGQSLDGSHPVQIRAAVPAPTDALVVLLRDGQEVASGSGSVTFAAPAAPALYRAEVRLPGSSVPWIVTNNIRIGPPPPAIESRPATFQVIRALDDVSVWKAEKHSTSVSDVRPADGTMAMAFQLASGPISGQYAAMSYAMPGGEDFTAIRATLRAAAPMRLSVQVRQPGGADGERWHRSVYVDETPREVTLALSDFQLGEHPTPRKPTPTLVRSLMFVVDTWHTRPGTSGTVWVSGVSIGRLPEPATSAR